MAEQKDKLVSLEDLKAAFNNLPYIYEVPVQFKKHSGGNTNQVRLVFDNNDSERIFDDILYLDIDAAGYEYRWFPDWRYGSKWIYFNANYGNGPYYAETSVKSASLATIKPCDLSSIYLEISVKEGTMVVQ